MSPNAEDLAYGRWPEILAAAGMDQPYLTGRSGPCPYCGGKDRYQFHKGNGGRYVCRNCTEGRYRSGFDLLMRHMGYASFQEAANHVREYFNIAPRGEQPRYVERPKMDREIGALSPELVLRRVGKMKAIWSASRPVQSGDPVALYLSRRVPGLRSVPKEVHFHPALEYWDPPETMDGRPTLRGRYPAMVVRGFDPKGELVQLHKTFLTSDGYKADVPNPKKTDVGVGSNSFALRMGDPTDGELGICEGIETGLASMLLRPGIPVWPCHSAGVLANFVVPEHLRGAVKRVLIFSDCDARAQNGRRAGQEASAKVAASLRKDGYRSLILQPAKVGTDMVDLVQVA